MRRIWLLCGVIGLGLLVGLSTSPAMAVAWMPDGNTDLGRPGDDPKAAGSHAYDVGTATHTVEGGGSDVWNAGEYCHYAYKSMSGDFWLESDVEWVNRTGNWGDMDGWVKAGLLVRNDVDTGAGNEKEVNNVMALLRPDREGVSYQWRNTSTSNMSSHTETGYGVVPQKVALNLWTDPEGDRLAQAFVDLGGGAGWQQVGPSRWTFNTSDPVYAGLFVTAHKNDGRLETAHFRNVEILAAQTPAGPLPRKPGDPVADPEGVGPYMGGWGVVEVVDNGNMGSVGAAVASIEGGGGTRHQYNLIGALNINDSDPQSDAANFPGDGPYGVTAAGIKAAGSVDDIALLARGIVDIPVEDDWTFYVRSDDGVELTVDDRALVISSETWNANNFGTVHLTAGWHNIQVVHREDGGGANVEVAAARGQTTNLQLFRLIGSGDPGAPAYSVWVPGLDGDVTVESTTPEYNNPRAESRDTALLEIANARVDGEIHAAVADRVNHSDPDNGGGIYGGDLPFPNDVAGTDDNDFATMATGTLVIPVDGTYYIGYRSDDGMALQIQGGVWDAIVEDATGNAIIDPADDSWMVTDAWTGNSHTVGQITLTAGNYPFTAVSYEGGGGAYMEMFGSTQQGNYYLITSGPGQEIVVPAAADALDLVPEPGSLGLLAVMGLLGLVGLAWRRRRK